MFYNFATVMKKLNVTEDELHNMISEDYICVFRNDGELLFDKHEIDTFDVKLLNCTETSSRRENGVYNILAGFICGFLMGLLF